MRFKRIETLSDMINMTVRIINNNVHCQKKKRRNLIKELKILHTLLQLNL